MRRRSIALFFIVAVTGAAGSAGCGPPDDGPPGDASTSDDGASRTPDAGTTGSDAGAVMDVDAGTTDAGPGDSDGGAGPGDGVVVMGHELLKDGAPFQVRGVNRSGSEYVCVQGWGLFDGPTDDASLDAIAAWGANAVRVPMNEDCWLGINGVAAAYSGSTYRDAILAFAARIEAHGLTPILELHWTAPGTAQATGQEPMPDRDHTLDFWRGVAAAVAGDPYVMLELFNEPYPDSNHDTNEAWRCWRDGGTCAGISYTVAGMQELVDAVRSAGAHNVILLGGVRYSSSLSQWLAHEPDDPLGQLAAAWHIYNFNACVDSTCFDGAPTSVAAAVPIVATEIGEDDCSGSFITGVMGWLDAHGEGYLGWTWDTWSGCLVLIDDYAGTPHGAYGTAYRDHLLSLAP